jgi:two-component system, OmpR family, alkaline phosphatase synthesis response regulator PhoP
MQILIIEDEQSIADLLEFNLSAEGYTIIVARDGETGLITWLASNPDLVVLDVMLPKKNGFQVCREARAAKLHTPVLFLTAKNQPHERVEGFAAGADDYLTKPFHLPEFLMRVAAILRRAKWLRQDSSYRFADISIDFLGFTVSTPRGFENLGEREMLLLKLFTERPNQVISRNEILDLIWGQDNYPSNRTVDNFVVRLRKILEPTPSQPRYLHTIWGVGYKFTPTD